MAFPVVFDSTATNPGGTGSTITVTLPTHAVGDIIYISIGNTGNTLWTGNPAGWNRIQQVQVGTATNGLVGTFFWRKIVSGDTLPLANPVFTLGATVTREAFARTIRGADLEGPFTLPEWASRAYSTNTNNPIRPGTITTPAPEGLILLDYFQRAATNAPDQTGYTQDQEIVISGTLVGNASEKQVADQRTVLTNQDASPTSGARWVAGIVCVPSPDYVYYRSGTAALTAAGTNATPALPTGTSASDNRGNKDLVIATIECAGTPTIAPNTPADWNEITGFAATTSGGGSTTRKYWTLYDGTLDRQFNRSTSGEIYVYLSTYRNTRQTNPTGSVAVQPNASGTSSAFPSLVRGRTKSTIQITCVADAAPSYTSPSPWVERNDGNGTTCADQSFNAVGTVSAASFTLSTASPTLAGVAELSSVSGEADGLVLLEDNFDDNSRDTAKWTLGSVAFENAAVGVAEANQQIEITPLSLTGTPAIYGYKSVDAYDFTGREASVRIAADIDPNTEAWLVVALDANNYLRTWVAGGNLQTRSRVDTNNANVSHGAFNFAVHTYWRIRHDNGTDEIVWEYSADRITWIELRRITRPLTITSMNVYLSGGTGSSIASPGLVKFDDFFLRDPPHSLAMQDGIHGHAADSIALTQTHALELASSSHLHAAENVILETSAASSLIAQYGSTHRGVFGRVFSGVN